MHEFGHLRGFNSLVVEHPMQHESIDDDKDDHEVEHGDDTSNPSLPCSSCNRKEIEFSEDKERLLLALCVHSNNKNHDDESTERPDDEDNGCGLVNSFLIDLIGLRDILDDYFIKVRSKFLKREHELGSDWAESLRRAFFTLVELIGVLEDSTSCTRNTLVLITSYCSCWAEGALTLEVILSVLMEEL
jgi:hypothetical protein